MRNVIYCQNFSLCHRRLFMKFCLKSPPFFQNKQLKNIQYQEENITFDNIVTLVQVFFSEVWRKISLFFRLKQVKQLCARRANVIFCQNCDSETGGSSLAKERLFTRRKKRCILKIYRCGTGDFSCSCVKLNVFFLSRKSY